MALTDEEYRKLVDICLELRLTESTLAETLGKLQRTNEILRELLLKETI